MLEVKTVLHKEQEVKVMASVRVNIQCPCGALLLSRLSSDKGKSNGLSTCPACKKKCKWNIVDGVGFAGYVR